MQILPQRQDWGSALGQGLGQGLAQGVNEHYQDQRQLQQTQKMSALQQEMNRQRGERTSVQLQQLHRNPDFLGADIPKKLSMLAPIAMESGNPQLMKEFSQAYEAEEQRKMAKDLFGIDKETGVPRTYEQLNDSELAQATNNPLIAQGAKQEFARRQSLFKESNKKRTAPANEIEKLAQKDFFEALSSASSLKNQAKNLERLNELSGNLRGIAGYAGSIFGGKDAAEFDSLSLGALEAPIHALFGKGVIAKEKFNSLKDKMMPKAGETYRTQQGKIKALKAFSNEAQVRAQHALNLYNEYGFDIPVEEFYRYSIDNEMLVSDFEKKLDRLNNEDEKEAPLQNETIENKPKQELAYSIDKNPNEPPNKEIDNKKNVFDRREEAFGDTDLANLQREGHVPAQIGRGIAKGIGSLEDFRNWVQSFLGDFATYDIKDDEGKKISAEQLAEKAYDYITNHAERPSTIADKYIQSAGKLGTEFAAFGGIGKGANVIKAGTEGALSGIALQTAKDAELGPMSELASLFIGPLAANAPKIKNGLMEIAKNPAILKEMGKDFLNFVKEAPKKGYNYLKERTREPFAKIAEKELDLKSSQINKKGEKRLAEGIEQPLSEVFNNEQVYALESKISQQPEGKAKYQPLFDKVAKENFDRYEKVLADSANKKNIDFIHEFNTPQRHKELVEEFFETVFQENAATRAQFRDDFDALRKSRPVDARLSIKETKALVKIIDNGIEELKKGGTITKDMEPMRYLQSFKERLLEVPAESKKEISRLQSEMAQAEKNIASNEERYGKMLDKVPELKKEHQANKELIKKNEKSINELGNIGARVEEAEKGYRKVNKALNWEKAFEYKDFPRLNLKSGISKVIKSYGTKNPKYANAFENLNKKYSSAKETILSDMVFDFIQGENPEMVMKWLDTPKGIQDFNELIASTHNLFFNDLGKIIKAAKAHEIVSPKLFTPELRLRPKPGKFTQKEEKLLHALLGNKSYNNLKTLQKDFSKDSGKLQAYLNGSNTAVHASMEASYLAQASGIWDIIRATFSLGRGNFKQAIKEGSKAGTKILYSKKDKLLSYLLTDSKFQEELLKVVRESETKRPPNHPMKYEALNNFARLFKERGLPITELGNEE